MEDNLETERDWAYLCQAFRVAKEAPLEAEKEYITLSTVPLLAYGSEFLRAGDAGTRVPQIFSLYAQNFGC